MAVIEIRNVANQMDLEHEVKAAVPGDVAEIRNDNDSTRLVVVQVRSGHRRLWPRFAIQSWRWWRGPGRVAVACDGDGDGDRDSQRRGRPDHRPDLDRWRLPATVAKIPNVAVQMVLRVLQDMAVSGDSG